jgi:predicted glutamine amidotransferase
MTQLFGSVCNDPERLVAALRPAQGALTAPSAPHGWGLAFYQGGEVLLQRHPKPVLGPLDLHAAVQGKQLRTEAVLGQVREQATGEVKLDDTPPFRFRSWVFGLLGELPSFDEVRPKILEHMPEFLQRNIRGATAPEHIFHLFLAFLHDGGKLDDPNVRPGDVAGALRATYAALAQFATTPAPLDVIVTNGRCLLAARQGAPMWVYFAKGLPPDAPEADRRPRGERGEHTRVFLVVAGHDASPTGPAWEELPTGSILTLSRDFERQVTPLK